MSDPWFMNVDPGAVATAPRPVIPHAIDSDKVVYVCPRLDRESPPYVTCDCSVGEREYAECWWWLEYLDASRPYDVT